ncbi:DUF6893 family small protein [Rhodococcus sp. NPDC003382]
MRIVGMLTTAVAAAVAVGAALVAVKSLPDLKRYFRIRNM